MDVNTKMKLLTYLVLVGMSAWAQARPAADLIVTHANIYTVDRRHPKAEAVAVIGARIVAVGSRGEIDSWRGAATRVIDAHGRLLLPGFNDSHVHFTDGGADLAEVQLNDATSAEELKRRLAAQAARTAGGEWILGGAWDETKWSPKQQPTAALIDDVTRNVPVYISRYDGHQGLANSVAMRLAGVSAGTADVAGGVIVRDESAAPTGIFKDAAQELIFKVIPPRSHEQRLADARRALAHAASVGVTSVQHMSAEYADVEVYSELLEKGQLTARIYCAPLETGWQDQARVGMRRAWGSGYLRLGAVKGFADGSIGSRTAALLKPYSDEPDNRGILSAEMQPPEAMRERLMQADAAGLQLRVHAIGDRAISLVLDMFEAIEKANGYHDQRMTIEHAQHTAPEDLERFARLHVIASMQPYHAIDDGRWVEARIGHERARTSYAWRSLLDHGVTLAFGTDWDVAPLNPLLGLYAAVTRATLDGRNPQGWIPEQKITLAEAVEAYTLGSAYAEFQENDKGSITAGKLADMVILSDDIFAMRPEAIRNVKVETTIVGGRIVYGGPPPR